jgi:hypothetical protein
VSAFRVRIPQGYEYVVLTYLLDSSHQVPTGLGLDDVASSARIQGFTQHLTRVVLGQHQNFAVGSRLVDQAACLKAVHAWHRDIQKHHVRVQSASLFDSFDAIGGLIDHLAVGLGCKQAFEPVSYDGVIVDEQYSNSHKLPLQVRREID